MLTSSQSGSHEIEAVESGAGIAGDLNYMRNEKIGSGCAFGQIWQEGTVNQSW
jgi:hypothetical protein